ncbi:hypothetical protein ABB37_07636 [Leptomonas pyrrhocoris]|uniref:Uncharacterized protein n=1 Tax=Leptomonas pyrrhocoris TaxID=157538 RepID=A0A0M9FVH4_LEPPY|nr:hypothetical protein ABB37_07636 [Leptomonas pyrrhocoris]KPA76833.1 hypothetical protein ABB37_07636 [Leptomonas pyrrhocoris]|eukprot:XP_015655272.1 hypothetical protein ABB37_07636 [Leptomonas pyrrhocoris]
MRFLIHSLSYYLKEYPLRSNLVLSTTVGFCGDVVCQTVYEPWTQSRPPLTRERLPDESRDSVFLLSVDSPFLCARNMWREYQASSGRHTDLANGSRGATSTTAESQPVVRGNTTVLLDLRRSMIFCSFTFIFGVPYFLWVYRHLDRLINPAFITKRNAIAKGFLSYVAAQVTNPIYLTYVTALDHFFIYRDGRDGRRRVMAIPMTGTSTQKDRVVEAGDEDAKTQRSTGRIRFSFSPFRNTSKELDQTTVHKMGYYYRFVGNTDFNFHEYYTCVSTDVERKLLYDFPDIMKYGLMFWSVNWLPMFYYIPCHFRLAYSSMVQVAWSGVMSHLLHRWKKMDGDDIRMRRHRLH